MRLFLISLLTTTCLASAPFAQEARTATACDEDGCREVSLDPADHIETTRAIATLARDVLALSGLEPNFAFRVDFDIHNAAAWLDGTTRVLGYNPNWLASVTKGDAAADRWLLVGTVAHEIGHHLQGHTLIPGGSKPATELEADRYSGYVMAAMGASLAEAQATFADDPVESSSTHPGRDDRMFAVAQGWNRFHQSPMQPRLKRVERATDTAPKQDTGAPRPAPQVAAAPVTDGQSCAAMEAGTVCAASALADYPVAHLVDGGIRTPWIESNPAAPRVLTYQFDSPRTLRQLVLHNGHNDSERDFKRHGRVQSLQLRGSDGTTQEIVVQDRRSAQDYVLFGFDQVDWVEITVDRVFEGRRYDALAISSLELR